MINASELRLGNWVECLKEFKSTKEKYKNNDPIYCKIESLHTIGINVQVNRKTLEADWNYKDLTGIPLTPGILEKAGFKKDDYNKLSKEEVYEFNDGKRFYRIVMTDNIAYSAVFYRYDPGYEYNKDGDNYHAFLNKCPYLHQLQNLFYCLTGEELNIEL